MRYGYYPFYREGLDDFYDKVLRIIEKAIFEDIANFYNLKTPNLHYFKKILHYLATIPPGELNVHTLAKNIGLDHKTIAHYINILDETKLAQLIFPVATGNQILRKPEKLFINNTTLLHTLNQNVATPINLGTQREIFFCQAIKGAGLNCCYTKQGDFCVNELTFEIGGKNKSAHKNHAAIPANFIVKDNIWTSSASSIPLACFGFLY